MKINLQINIVLFCFIYRNGNLQARQIEPVSCRVEGVVCSLKDSFGFIERADVVKEIFFHYSEFKGDINKLNLGDDVDFDIQTRNVINC